MDARPAKYLTTSVERVTQDNDCEKEEETVFKNHPVSSSSSIRVPSFEASNLVEPIQSSHPIHDALSLLGILNTSQGRQDTATSISSFLVNGLVLIPNESAPFQLLTITPSIVPSLPTVLFVDSISTLPTQNIDQVARYDIGNMTYSCPYDLCRAKHFEAEGIRSSKEVHYISCCHNRTVRLPSERCLRPAPELLIRLLTENSKDGRNYLECIRSFNNSSAFASFGTKSFLTKNTKSDRGPHAFKIHGQVYHKISSNAASLCWS